jgi:hypothetical protein
MRMNNTIPENRPIFEVRIVQFGSKISVKNQIKQLPLPRIPLFPIFMVVNSYSFICACSRSYGVHRSGVQNRSPICPASRDLRDIRDQASTGSSGCKNSGRLRRVKPL